jgi:hypothetical protein
MDDPSTQNPKLESRHLFAGDCLGSKQVPPKLIPVAHKEGGLEHFLFAVSTMAFCSNCPLLFFWSRKMDESVRQRRIPVM